MDSIDDERAGNIGNKTLRIAPDLDRCGELWRERGDPGSGWDLIQALHSPDPDRQSIAQEWLSQTREFFSYHRILSIVPKGSSRGVKSCSQALLDERIRLNVFGEVDHGVEQQ